MPVYIDHDSLMIRSDSISYFRNFPVIAVLMLFLASCAGTSSSSVDTPEAASITASADTSSVEWMEVYFNMPADTTFSRDGIRVNDSHNLISTLTDLIDEAKYSVDLAIYDLQNHLVGEALVRARERGLRVRVIVDYANRTNNPRFNEPMWEMLREGDIITMDDSGTIFWPDGRTETNRITGAGSFMHHKFAVIDATSDDPDDLFTWAGSMNLTYTGPYNTNLTFVIKDSGITKAFEEEFEMMWGSSGDEPDPSRARFKRDKRNVSQNLFWVDQTKVELYFSPMNRDRSRPSVSDRIVELVQTEVDHDMAFIAFAITPTIPISQAIWQKSADPDILLNGVIDRSFYGRYRNQGEIWASPEARILGRSIMPGRELRKLHHKTLILDALNDDPDDTAIVISGSYNFSAAAENANDEYVFMIHSDVIANQFIQDFMGIKSRARGDTEPPVPDLNPDQWYRVANVVDAQIIEVELSPNLRYPVSLLGVDAPRLFAGPDSSHYHAGASKAYLEKILEGREVRMTGVGGVRPTDRYQRYYAYVNARDGEGNEIAVNRKMLKHGMADYSRFYLQHPDSIQAYRNLVDEARAAGLNQWANPELVKTRVPRHQESDDVQAAPDFPININTATAEELTALPNIGPARARAIIEYRETNGPFRSVQELQNIRGIGPVTVENLESLVEV